METRDTTPTDLPEQLRSDSSCVTIASVDGSDDSVHNQAWSGVLSTPRARNEGVAPATRGRRSVRDLSEPPPKRRIFP